MDKCVITENNRWHCPGEIWGGCLLIIPIPLPDIIKKGVVMEAQIELDEVLGVVYAILNMSTGLVYLGYTTKDPKERWNEHLRLAEYKKEYKLYLAINEYGYENFCFWVVENGIPKSKLKDLERYYIDLWNTIWPRGYNNNRGGGGPMEHTPETKRIMSQKRKELHADPNSGYNTEEYKELQSKKQLGKKYSPERLEQMSVSAKKVCCSKEINSRRRKWSDFHTKCRFRFRINKETKMKTIISLYILATLLLFYGCGNGPDQVVSPSKELRPDGRLIQLKGRYEGVVERRGSFTTVIIRTYDHKTQKTHRYHCKFHGQANNTLINHRLFWDQAVEFKGYVISERDPDFTIVDYCIIVTAFDPLYWN